MDNVRAAIVGKLCSVYIKLMDIEPIRQRVKNAINPVKPGEIDPATFKSLIFSSKRTDAGRTLPPYYLVYFLLVDLLGFRKNGPWDKTAWSVSVDYCGVPFLIEHRKFGLGIFGIEVPDMEANASRLAGHINRAVKVAKPYFDWRAKTAAEQSHLNVWNRSGNLLDHVHFHLNLYEKLVTEAVERKDERVKTQIGENSFSIHYPSSDLRRDAGHYAIAAIEGFFSWTEHVFIHIAILRGKVSTGVEVGELAKADWNSKYKAALGVTDRSDKRIFDDLTELRYQLRNFVAHGSFGKNGEAFEFHSGAGAVPLMLPDARRKTTYRFGSGVDLQIEPAIALVRAFLEHVWTGHRAPARIYIQDYQLPAILPLASDGTYANAMRSKDAMRHLAEFLSMRMDKAADMDF